MDDNTQIRINFLWAFFLVGVALLIDALQGLLDLLGTIIPGLFIVPWFMSGAAFILFFLWFKLLHVNYLDRNASTKLFIMLASAVVELVPLVNMIPAITLGVVSLIVVSRMEDGENFLSNLSRDRRSKQSPEERAGSMAWAQKRFGTSQDVADKRGIMQKQKEYEDRGEKPGRAVDGDWSEEGMEKELVARRKKRLAEAGQSHDAQLYNAEEAGDVAYDTAQEWH